jgi:hypothetical protein
MSDTQKDQLRELLAVIGEALALPIPAYDGREAHRDLLMARSSLVRGVIASVLANVDTYDTAPASIRSLIDEYPVTYEVIEKTA